MFFIKIFSFFINLYKKKCFVFCVFFVFFCVFCVFFWGVCVHLTRAAQLGTRLAMVVGGLEHRPPGPPGPPGTRIRRRNRCVRAGACKTGSRV